MPVQLDIDVLLNEYAVVGLSPNCDLPTWAIGGNFSGISRDGDETTVVCPRAQIPLNIDFDGGWACLKLRGSFDFDQAGILLSAIRPLSEAGIGVFAISTFKRDYLLIKRSSLASAKDLLVQAGHNVAGAA